MASGMSRIATIETNGLEPTVAQVPTLRRRPPKGAASLTTAFSADTTVPLPFMVHIPQTTVLGSLVKMIRSAPMVIPSMSKLS